MSQPDQDGELFTRLLLQNQKRIWGLILSLIPRGSDADDVMQETCAVLWRKFNQFQPGTDFGAWALRVARFQLMSHYNKRRRAQAHLSEEVVEALAETLADRKWEDSERSVALNDCLHKLKDREMDLIQRRYTAQDKIEDIAKGLGTTVHAVYKALARLQVRLMGCVEREMRVKESL